jgi:hypothetical protein
MVGGELFDTEQRVTATFHINTTDVINAPAFWLKNSPTAAAGISEYEKYIRLWSATPPSVVTAGSYLFSGTPTANLFAPTFQQ